MTRKCNDNSNLFTDWTVKKLKREFRAYKKLFNSGTGTDYSDLMNFEGIKYALEERSA